LPLPRRTSSRLKKEAPQELAPPALKHPTPPLAPPQAHVFLEVLCDEYVRCEVVYSELLPNIFRKWDRNADGLLCKEDVVAMVRHMATKVRAPASASPSRNRKEDGIPRPPLRDRPSSTLQKNGEAGWKTGQALQRGAVKAYESPAALWVPEDPGTQAPKRSWQGSTLRL